MAEQGDVDDPADLLRGDLLDGAVEADGRGVDPRVDAPEVLDGTVAKGPHLVELGGVSGHHERLAAQALDLVGHRLEGLLVASSKDHGGAPLTELHGGLPSDPR